MIYKPVPPIEAFAEALSVPPMLHVTPAKPINVLIFGQFALPLGRFALRYPNTVDVRLVSTDTALKDQRCQQHDRLDDLPSGWLADIVAIAVPGDPTALLPELKLKMKADGVIVVAIDQFAKGRKVKDAMQVLWKQTLPYREYAPDPALFLMASDRKFSTSLRPLPTNLKRLNTRYIQAIFTLAKDEYALLYGPK